MSSCSTSKPKTIRVVSKYFNDSKAGMDESLTEFQEPKKNVRGPKSVNATKAAAKPRGKKQRKIKGQKDIKSAFQKNDIVEFTEDFNRICKQSGVDVDAEQLQLAIALSKSLHNTKNEGGDSPDDSVPTTSQQRSGKVRSTLLEYGFKVPEVKIDNKSSRRLKKCKKNSLLLLKSNEEKLQNIANKYSQVIFDNLESIKENKDDDRQDCTEFNPIYNKATNTKYIEMKNNEYFYIEDLIDASTEPIGSLLKDWSTIPGRSKSPTSVPKRNIQVSNIELSETELDVVLSGKLLEAQKIVFDKSEFMKSQTQEMVEHPQDDCALDIVSRNKDSEEESKVNDFMIQCDKESNLEHLSRSKEPLRVRSPSPDLLDDDLSIVADGDVIESKSLNKSNILFIDKKCSTLTNAQNDIMDLTNCVLRRNSLENVSRKVTIDMQEIVICDNSNDSMEVYICKTSVQENSNHEENIISTQNSDQDNDVTIVKHKTNKSQCNNLVIMDSSDDDDETLPLVELGGQRPKICLENESHSKYIQEQSVMLLDHGDIDHKVEKNETVIREKSDKSSKASTNFEEYSYNHSDEGSNLKQHIDLTKIEVNENSFIDLNCSPKIDLTQSSNSSLEKDTAETVKETEGLGIVDDVSVIYDDVVPESEYQFDIHYEQDDRIDVSTTEAHRPVTQTNNSSISQQDLSQKTINTDAESDIFEISDEELNFSMHNSKFHLSQDNISEPDYESPNFDLGGISVINNLTTARNSINKSEITADESKTQSNESKNDSFLPAIEIAGIQIKSPKKNNSINVNQGPSIDIDGGTPKNSGFIVKTAEVTPLVDYASLSTPDRNKELDKYGLKPFKRKRAIQLLTHLYNQTHPIVEVTKEPELVASPAKKLKPSQTISPRSPRKPPTPQKSPICQGLSLGGACNSDVLYEITNYPPLNEVECCSEDWVFQKREKAKVHSCRLPLHIAVYNYVSSSQTLRDAILRYEPVNIDVIHKDLAALGHRYDPKDLLKYLDKKCITVKTADNNTRNEKKSRRKL